MFTDRPCATKAGLPFVHFLSVNFNILTELPSLSEETNIRGLAAGPSYEGLYYEQLWKNKSMPTTDRGKKEEKKNPAA